MCACVCTCVCVCVCVRVYESIYAYASVSGVTDCLAPEYASKNRSLKESRCHTCGKGEGEG